LEEWRNEEKAEEENRTSKEVQQEQEVVACAALVFAAYSAAPFSIVDFQGNKPFLRNRFSNAG
jgi:adenylate kinase